MKHTPLFLLTLVAASAPAFAQSNSNNGGSKLSYDRISVGYSSNDGLKSTDLTATALIGSGLLVSGYYADVKGKGTLAGYSGKMTGFGLGYKFAVGPGDLIATLAYAQGQFDSSTGVAQAEQTSYGLHYRQALSDSFEFSVGVDRASTDLGALTIVGGYVYAGAETSNDTFFTVSARYNITRNLDATVSYLFQSGSTGANTLGLSVGYKF